MTINRVAALFRKRSVFSLFFAGAVMSAVRSANSGSPDRQDGERTDWCVRGAFQKVPASPESRADTLSGTFYYSADGKTLLMLVRPISQVFWVNGTQMVIYYPERKRAFKLQSREVVVPPVVGDLPMVLKPDYGLSQLGFRSAEHALSNDTLYVTWELATSRRSKASAVKFITAEVKGHLAWVRAEASDGKAKYETHFQQYRLIHRDVSLPERILYIRYSSTESDTVWVRFSHLHWLARTPAMVKEYQIPEGVIIEERTW